MSAARLPRRLNVKSCPDPATDAHEQRRDVLNEAEIAVLLDGARAGRHGIRDQLIRLRMYRHGRQVGEAVGRRVHPHRLRSSCGVALADKGHDLRRIQDDLGQRDPKHTVHDTRIAGCRFDGLWGR